MNRRNVAALLALLVVVSLAPTAMAAGFELSSSDTTPVPERTVEFESQSFTFDSMIRADEGDTVSVDVTAPNDEEYRLHVRNSDNDIVESSPRRDGDQSFTFDLSGAAYEHGSYVIAVYQDGNYEEVLPLLVRGYDVSVAAPSSVSSGDAVDVTVDVSQTAASSSPATVTVIAAQDGTAHEVTATEDGGEYVATIDGGQLDAGGYTLYAVAQGDEEAFGRQEIQGLSDGHALTVESDSNGDDGSNGSDDATPDNSTENSDDSNDSTNSTDDSDSSSDDSDSTDNSDDTAGGDDSGSDDSGPDDSTNESVAADDSDGAANPPANETATESPTPTPTETATETTTPTETDDGVLTPGGEEQTESTDASGPGFTVVGALAALALVALLGGRRS